MGYGSGKLDMSHSFTSYLGAGNLNAAALADLAFKAYLLVFSAVTFPVLGWTEDSFAEQTVSFRLLGAVVYGFRLFNNAVRPASYLFGRCKTDFY